jgi:hypothetical protein
VRTAAFKMSDDMTGYLLKNFARGFKAHRWAPSAVGVTAVAPAARRENAACDRALVLLTSDFKVKSKTLARSR